MRRLFSTLALLLLTACTEPTVLLPKTYADLPGWKADHASEAYKLFVESCQKKEERGAPYKDRDGEDIGDASLWSQACEAAYGFPNPTNEEARTFFEDKFSPWQVTTASKQTGLITGYYEPLLHGSKTKQGTFRTPVYGVPDDLVAGTPYLTREEIEAGKLKGHAKILLYVDDPVMLFFLHIQGSGKVRLPGGGLVGLQYAAQNGRPFVPIGRVLKDSGDIEESSMQSIRDWLYDHPERAQEVMNENPSYIFFKLSPGTEMAKGALGLPLTPLRSIAIDDDRAAYGVPTYIATEHNDYDTRTPQPMERLFVSQDTGGALYGPNRTDIFFGRGEEAEWEAGRQNARGLVYWLLPRPEEKMPQTIIPGTETPAEDIMPQEPIPSADLPPPASK